MSRSKLLSVLVLAAVTELCGIAVGHYLGLSQFASVGVGLVPALLVAFPLMKWWNRSHLSFAQWSITVGMMTAMAVLIHLVIS